MASIVVQKYGGSSVGSTERIMRVAERVVALKRSGKQAVIVVSAMGDMTDHLVEQAKSINPHPSSREMDMLLSTGEQISISLLAMAIERHNEKVVSLTGGQSGIITDNVHKRARIAKINPERVLEALNNDQIVIVAGFQGVTDNGDITTLGRGGSDTTAVALAAALNAEACEIYTDVAGVYTADPRQVPSARLLSEISYDEMLELARLGAKVLHPRSVELARKYNIPLVVKSSFEDLEGTRVTGVINMEQLYIRGVSLDSNIAKISVIDVPDKPGIAFQLFSSLAEHQVHIDMIFQNLNHDKVNDISFTVDEEDMEKAIEIASEFSQRVMAKSILFDTNVTKLSIVGTGISGNAEVASQLFGALFELGINIQMISTSEIKISCIINQDDGEKALKHIHEVFNLDKIDIVP